MTEYLYKTCIDTILIRWPFNYLGDYFGIYFIHRRKYEKKNLEKKVYK